MKGFLVSMVMAFFSLAATAQFTSARLQATGLTCAMCSNAINKALQKLPFVESVKSDVKNSSFDIVFRKEAVITLEQIKKAVEGAGYAVGELKVTGTFSATKVSKDQPIRLGDENFHVLNAGDTLLNGEQTFTMVDRSYITEKEFKKVSREFNSPCLLPGKSAAGCRSSGVTGGDKTYHVML